VSEPTRAHPRRTICVCRLKIGDRPEGPVWDSCTAHTSGPDEPVCRNCEESGHPTSEHFDPIIKKEQP